MISKNDIINYTKQLPRYTFGMGDRFAREGTAQMKAVMTARTEGMDVHPVWNKSNREHTIIGSRPSSVREEADAAVAQFGFNSPYFVDADHIGLQTVDGFLQASDFFTLDVAEYVGQPAVEEVRAAFLARRAGLVGKHHLPELGYPVVIMRDDLEQTADLFLAAMREAGEIYRHIARNKVNGPFVVEVSVDETTASQTPGELMIILAMIADEGIPAQTIAPKFTGRFNKGVDYVGDIAAFEREFDADLAVLAYAVGKFGLPGNLKLSIHSGSDKFSLYPVINRIAQKHQAGLHVKTAGTTWLEEVIGLAESGGDALDLAREIYCGAFMHYDALVAPYHTVVDIDRAKLPLPEEVSTWLPERFASALRHDPACPLYSADMRQLMHVGFKVAAGMGSEFIRALDRHRDRISANVTHNLLSRHIRPIFHGLC